MEYVLYDNLSCEELLNKYYGLYCEVFGNDDSREKWLGRMQEKKNLCLVLALKDGVAVGFKLGCDGEGEGAYFYIWLGGVSHSCRGHGVAKKLMDLQHSWCQKKGYPVIQTRTLNKFKPMLILNLRSGFDIQSTYIDSDGALKIVLEKKFSRDF